MIWFSSLALAIPPDHQVDLVAVLSGVDGGTGGVVDSLVVSDDGEVLVGRLGVSRQGFVFDLDRWTMHVIDGTGTGQNECSVTGITAFSADGITHIWMSCNDGLLEERTYDDGVLEVGSTVDRASIGTLSAVFVDPSVPDQAALPEHALYAIELDESSFGLVHAIDPSDPTALSFPAYPKGLTQQGLIEAQVTSTGSESQISSLVVSHGNRRMSTLLLNGSAEASPNWLTAITCDDMAVAAIPNTVYCLDESLGVVQAFNTLANAFAPIPELTDLVGPKAVGASRSPTDNWIAVTGDRVQVWPLDSNGVVTGEPVFDLVYASNPIRDIVSHDGYLFGGGSSGRVHVVTARPWIERESFSITPDDGQSTDEVTVTFTVAEAEGDLSWTLYRGGDRTGAGGGALTSGTAVVREEVEATFTLNGAFAEGTNDLFVVVSDSRGIKGHIGGGVVVDNSPAIPVLAQADVGFGDRRIEIAFDGVTDADLDAYEVYVATEPFDPTSFASGGPIYNGTARFENPLVLSDAKHSTETTISIEPLENDVKHYIAVRAVDSGDKESALSNVVSGTPSRGLTGAEAAGESGGSPCSEGCATQGSSTGWGWATAVLVGLGLVRRRRHVAAAFAAAMALGSLAVATPAQAKDDDHSRQSILVRKDSSPVVGNFEFRYGSFAIEDPDISSVYNSSLDMFQFEAGPQILRFAEIDVGFNLVRNKSNPVRALDGASSSDEIRLTIIPITLDVTLRAHVLDEQPVVPFVRYGWDYAFFSERRLGEDNATPVRGAKTGSHLGAGVNLLLDILSPNRASLLEAQSGINDTWVTLEWRRNRIDDRSRPWGAPKNKGFNFSGDVFSVGLKIDY